jgi:histidine triad (HIT) family protein
MPSVFSKIVAGEIPCHKVYEDERHIAFLDIKPVQPGHTLVVPKREVAYLFDMDPAEYDALWKAVREVERGVRRATQARRVVVTVVGWEVPHVHVHLIPTQRIEDFGLPAKMDPTSEQLTKTALAIRQALSAP